MPIATLNNRSHIAINGEEAQHFLHNLVTTDIAGLPEGEMRPGALLTAQGKVLFAFLVFRSDAGFMLEVAHQDATDFVKRLRFFRLRAKVDIADPVAVDVSVFWDEAKPEGLFLYDARFGKTGVWRAPQSPLNTPSDAPSDAPWTALWTALRIAHGVAEPHLDYGYNDVFPHDINLDQTGGLSFSKGCYVGQEVVSRMHHRGTARRRLMVARGEQLIQGADILVGGKLAGSLGSASGSQALALVRLDRIKDALDRHEPVMTGDKTIELNFPLGVHYDWPVAMEPNQ
jgi:tRNA-modifying protein YgfZ